MAEQFGTTFLHNRRINIRATQPMPRKLYRQADRAAKKTPAVTHVSRAFRYQARTINHVTPPTTSGIIPTRRFFPSQGKITGSWRVVLLNRPAVKIEPAWRPIASQRERVCRRASARIQPIKKRVVKPAATRIGSANCTKAWAIELKPEAHVTIVEVCSGAFRKCTIE